MQKFGKTVLISNLTFKVNATISFRLVRPRRAARPVGHMIGMLQVWSSSTASFNSRARLSFYSHSGLVNGYQIQLGLREGMILLCWVTGWQLILCKHIAYYRILESGTQYRLWCSSLHMSVLCITEKLVNFKQGRLKIWTCHIKLFNWHLSTALSTINLPLSAAIFDKPLGPATF